MFDAARVYYKLSKNLNHNVYEWNISFEPVVDGVSPDECKRLAMKEYTSMKSYEGAFQISNFKGWKLEVDLVYFPQEAFKHWEYTEQKVLDQDKLLELQKSMEARPICYYSDKRRKNR